jgi:Bacillus/Clostridium GerA spore germination protein.
MLERNPEEIKRTELESELQALRALSCRGREIARDIETLINCLRNNQPVFLEVGKNEKYLKARIGESFDTNYRRFVVPALNDRPALVVFIKGLVDANRLDQFLLLPLMNYRQVPQAKEGGEKAGVMSLLSDARVAISSVEQTNLLTEACDAVLAGNAVLFVDQCNTALILSVRELEGRSVEEPATESEVRAPRDGFTEKIQINTALIRSRIKDPGLRFEEFKIGERTKTTVLLAYIESLASPSILAEARTRLNRIKVDGVLGSSYVEELIEDSPYSVFPQIDHTERPDKASAAILEGRIVILIDTTPFAMIIPTVFWNFLQSTGDYYERFFTGTFLRWIRFLALFMSVSVSSAYVLTTSFHQEMLPTTLALKIAEGRTDVPFPAFIEVLIMEIILEIIKEAGLRLPKAIGQSVTFVGSIIIGQAAVSAGLAGPALIIVVAMAAIGSFAIPSYSLGNAVRLLRFPMLFLTAAFGIFGYLAGLTLIVVHLFSLRSYGESFWAPLIPFDKSGMKDVFIRAPWWKMANRPGLSHSQEITKQASGGKPKPPNKGDIND